MLQTPPAARRRPGPDSGSGPAPRRGVTLVEMMVVVGLLVLVMSMIVVIFQSATAAVNTAQVTQDLDQQLRRLDTLIRTDLEGVTARMTPPLNPADELGYFTYFENQFSDPQGEDSDDILAFTTKAPPGQPFKGRAWLPDLARLEGRNLDDDDALDLMAERMPVIVTSEYAEVIYFQRGGNLYRRVLLIDPKRRGTLHAVMQNGTTIGIPANEEEPGQFAFHSDRNMLPDGEHVPFSWLGMNDLSARPGTGVRNLTNQGPAHPLNIENFLPIPNALGDLTELHNRFARPRWSDDYLTRVVNPSTNQVTFVPGPDGIPDDTNFDGVPDYFPTLYPNGLNAQARNILTGAAVGPLYRVPVGNAVAGGVNFQTAAFPFVPRMMVRGYDLNNLPPTGFLHPMARRNNQVNHFPLPVGDSFYSALGIAPTSADLDDNWFGMPTWAETSVGWIQSAEAGGQIIAYTDPVAIINNDENTVPFNRLFEPNYTNHLQPAGQRFAPTAFQDGVITDHGDLSFILINGLKVPVVYQDDLLATGIRSFDVKALDVNVKAWDTGAAAAFPFATAYVDLGYADVDADGQPGFPNLAAAQAALRTLGHEGRMPPLVNDFRQDPTFPLLNIGDNANIERLRRCWDTWSTTLVRTPRPLLMPSILETSNRPALPSYPPPYPEPLQGLQIQIRLTDPKNDKVRTLTIRHDFTGKL